MSYSYHNVHYSKGGDTRVVQISPGELTNYLSLLKSNGYTYSVSSLITLSKSHV